LLELSLSSVEVTDEGVEHLAQSRCLERLRELRTVHGAVTNLTAVGATHLARSRYLRAMQVLLIPNGSIGDAGLQALFESDALPRLRVLDINWNGISAAGASRLAPMPALARLTHLRMAQQEALPAAVGHLFAASPFAGGLLHLDLGPEANRVLGERFGLVLSDYRGEYR
jgi:hypothetical protein